MSKLSKALRAIGKRRARNREVRAKARRADRRDVAQQLAAMVRHDPVSGVQILPEQGSEAE
jgi:hypothetical protein